jgi:hypothetical protein
MAPTAQKKHGALAEMPSRKNMVLTARTRVCGTGDLKVRLSAFGATVSAITVLPGPAITQDVSSPFLASFWHPERIVGLCPPFF